MKKTIALVLVVLLIAAIVTPVAMAAGSTVRIREAEDLVQLAKNCQLDSYSANITVVLENDIDLGGAVITPIPTFSGTFDGGGHTISNFVINIEGSHQGLFRYVGAEASVKNLNLVGDVVPGGSALYVGAVVGTNRGTVKDCSFSGTVQGKENVGGIVGENYGKVSGCKAEGKLSGNIFTGGIVGYNNGAIENCVNYSSVNTVINESQLDKYTVDLTAITQGIDLASETDTISNTGGIAGASLGEIKGCTNFGTIGYQHYGYNVGGIVGRQSGYITGCENRGQVFGRQDVGGIVGQMEPNKTLINSGSLTEELNKLHDLADNALTNGNGSSQNVTDALNSIKDNTKKAVNSAGDVHAEVNSFVDSAVDSINEIVERIEYIIDELVPVTDNFSKATEKLTSALERLDEFISTLEMNDGDLAELDSNIDNLTASMKRMSYEMDYLAYLGVLYTQDSELASSDAEKMKPSAEEQKEAKEWFGYDYDKEYDGADDLTNAILVVIPDLIKDLAATNKAKSQILDILDEYYLDEKIDTDGDGIPDQSRLAYATDRAKEARDTFISASDYFDDVSSGISKLNSELSKMEDIRFKNLSSKYYDATDALYSNLNKVTDSMGTLNTAIDNSSDVATEDLKALNDQANVVLTMISNVMMGNWNYNDVEDISEENEQGNTNGKILSSTNYASVEADTNVGGIAGNMAEEQAEDLLQKIAEKIDVSDIISSSYEARCVIRDCVNMGSVVAKKDNVGGIAGKSELGTVISCEGYGPVESTDGSYVGGVVGNSATAVRSSYAMCSLSGNSYVGGIAGQGTMITDCRTLVGIKESGECVGTIAGYTDVLEEGNVSNNLYVNENVGAVDGISYAGIAERTTYEKLVADTQVPSDFSRLKLTYVVDGETVKTIDFKYGGTIDENEIPEVPEKEGFTGVWPEYDYSVLTFSDFLEAEYTPLQASMAAETVREDTSKNVVLVEGEFEDYANVIINEYDGEAPEVSGEEVAEMWVLRIEGADTDSDLSYSVRYLPPTTDEKTDYAIYVLKDGKWVETESTKSGSYIVFPCEGDTAVFASVTDSGNYMMWIYIAAAAAIIAIVVVSVVLVKRSKKKTSAAQSDND